MLAAGEERGPGVTVGVQRGQAASWEGLGGVPGSFWGGPGGALERAIFFFRREFVNVLMKSSCFQFGLVL